MGKRLEPFLRRTSRACARARRRARCRRMECAIGLWRPSKDLDVEVFGVPAAKLPSLLAQFGRCTEPIGRIFRLQDCAIDVGCPARIEIGRGLRLPVGAIRRCRSREAARRPRFTINAISWDRCRGVGIVPGQGPPAEDSATVDPADLRDDSLACAARAAVRRTFRAALEKGRRRCAARSLDDLPPERIWGGSRNSCRAERPSIGFARWSSASSISSSPS
jgi:hypothetical protein